MPHLKRHQRAFTIVELLVVIGIIAVLIGILVPVISQVRKAAYVADSRNQIQVISNAIDRYHTDHQAYPGYFSNAQLTAGTPNFLAGTTSSENLMLSLCGGLTGTYNAPTYTPGDVGKGPLTFGVTQKRLQSYLEVSPKAASVKGCDVDDATYFGTGLQAAATYTQDPVTYPNGIPGVPEFIDRFPQAMPIVYIRARVGANGVVGANNQYDFSMALPYIALGATKIFAFDSSSFPADSTNDQPNPSGYPNVSFAGSYKYLNNASLDGTAKRKDSYILISPGEDRKYGTSDDICNFTF